MKEELSDFRYEKKFVTEDLNESEIRHLIRLNPAVFSEIFHERVVNNIYLDSIDLENYSENVAGNTQRMKIRVRWYGSTFGIIRNPVLELKIKNNELGKKLSFPLKGFVLGPDFSFDKLQEVFLQSKLPEWLVEKLKFFQPSLLNSYERKYFISADKKFRITLDKDQVFYKIKKRDNSFIEKRVCPETFVLEIKYSVKDYDRIYKITDNLPFRLTANSKYVFGIDLLKL